MTAGSPNGRNGRPHEGNDRQADATNVPASVRPAPDRGRYGALYSVAKLGGRVIRDTAVDRTDIECERCDRAFTGPKRFIEAVAHVDDTGHAVGAVVYRRYRYRVAP